MDKNAPINIEPAANGFIVTTLKSDIYAKSGSDSHVFQSFAELIAFLGQHYDHRKTAVIVDTETKLVDRGPELLPTH